MQTVNHDGILGAIKECNPENMKLALRDPNVSHVQVFEGTDENIKLRAALVGKKYTVKKKFQKTGSNKK